jgi:hypothetical protein
LFPSLVTELNVNHFVATPILRALADVASPSEVDKFWSFCEQQLRSSRQGWPGQSTAKVLADFSSRLGSRGAWPRVAALLSAAGGGGVGALATGGGPSRAGAGAAACRDAGAPRVFCKNWQSTGSCPFGERCKFKDGHK